MSGAEGCGVLVGSSAATAGLAKAPKLCAKPPPFLAPSEQWREPCSVEAEVKC